MTARRAVAALTALSIMAAGLLVAAPAESQAKAATQASPVAARPSGTTRWASRRDGAPTVAEAAARALDAMRRPEPADGAVVRGRLVVETIPGENDRTALMPVLVGTGMRVTERLMAPRDGFGGMYLVSVPNGMELSDARALVLASTGVKGVSYDLVMRAEDDPAAAPPILAAEATSPNPYANDPGLADKWEDDAGFLDFQGTWDVAYDAGWRDSSSVTVAVLDSGIKADHEDLAANIVGTYDATGTSGMGDLTTNSHGTAVAGIVSSVTNNAKGTASLSYNAGLLPIQVFRRDAQNTVGAAFSDVARGMEYLMTKGTDGKTPAERHNVKVANLSVGAPTTLLNDPSSTQVESAISRLREEGIILVNSMGNTWTYKDSQNQSQVISVPYSHWPTEHEDCVGVIALAKDGDGVRRRSDSNYNLSASDLVAKVSAPGSGIHTTIVGEGTGAYTDAAGFSGTSAAAPQVSSLLALMYAVNPDMTADEATEILYRNVTPTLDADKAQAGNGMISPRGAVSDAAHDGALLARLHSMTASAGGTPVAGFDYGTEAYTMDYGQTQPSQDLPSEVTISVPSGWVATQSQGGPIEDRHDKTVDADGTTRGTRRRTLEYKVSSVEPGSSGRPLERTYRFTMSSSYIDTSTKYATVLAGARIVAGGQERDGFSADNHGPYRFMLNPDAIANVQPPTMAHLPEGWSQSTSSPSQTTETIARDDGTSVLRTSKSYTITLTHDGARLAYTVTLYSDAESTSPHSEDPSGGQGGGDPQGGDSGQGGSQDGSPSDSQQASDQGGSSQGTPNGSGQQGEATPRGGSGASGSQQAPLPQPQQQQPQAASSSTQGQQRAQSTGSLKQTGDATAAIAAEALAVAMATVAGAAKLRHDA